MTPVSAALLAHLCLTCSQTIDNFWSIVCPTTLVKNVLISSQFCQRNVRTCVMAYPEHTGRSYSMHSGAGLEIKVCLWFWSILWTTAKEAVQELEWFCTSLKLFRHRVLYKYLLYLFFGRMYLRLPSFAPYISHVVIGITSMYGGRSLSCEPCL